MVRRVAGFIGHMSGAFMSWGLIAGAGFFPATIRRIYLFGKKISGKETGRKNGRGFFFAEFLSYFNK
jgi:hypothetical protein